MVYTVKTQRRILACLFVLNIVNMSFESEGSSKYLFYFQIVLQIFILIGLFLDYKLKIDDGFLTYQISLFRVNLYKKRIAPEQIKRMKFVRVGWLSKGAIIQLEKGFNIRVTHYTPKTIIAELLDFADKEEIPVLKTRDFVILEK